MCAIFGYLGPRGVGNQDRVKVALKRLETLSRMRGRDGTRTQHYDLGYNEAVLGASRATPTMEIERAPIQPYDNIVHNGTISNDVDLGRIEGEVDSMVLPRILSSNDLHEFAQDIGKLVGSYAIGCVSKSGSTVFLARNYKPIFIYRTNGVTWFASMPYMLSHLITNGTDAYEMPAYTALDLSSFLSISIGERKYNSSRAIVVASAGLDSTTVATKYASEGKEVLLVHFTYGCRAETKEVERIHQIASYLRVTFATSCNVRMIQLPYSSIDSNSPLLNEGAAIAGGVEGAEFAYEWVPARNLVMTAAAVALAEAEGYGIVALGLNLEESGSYPDNEELMVHHLNRVMPNAVASDRKVIIDCPYDAHMKHEIVADGIKLKAPYHLTWSCYKGGEKPCRCCGPCSMREEAFKRNGTEDPLLLDLD